MSNPTGRNQYSGGRGKKRDKAAKMGAAMRSRSLGSSRVQLASGTSSAAHDAFIRAGLAKKAAAKKKRRR